MTIELSQDVIFALVSMGFWIGTGVVIALFCGGLVFSFVGDLMYIVFKKMGFIVKDYDR